ncbi:MAG: ribosome hibernation-promoting factor, HPF/YfiA family [Candidatus Avelusimicrobium sp.]
MKITATGRKVTLKPAFTERVEKRLAKLDKFFSEEAEASVTVTVERERQTVELTVRDKGFVARAERTDKTMETAFDDVADILTRRIIKNRKKLGDTICRAAETAYMPAEEPDEEYNVIREKRFFLKPQSVDEAILEMNMVGHTFYMFKDAETDKIEVVYRRKDDTYGLLIAD